MASSRSQTHLEALRALRQALSMLAADGTPFDESVRNFCAVVAGIVGRDSSDSLFDAELDPYAGEIVAIAKYAIEAAQREREAREELERLRAEAALDAVTGVPTRAVFDAELESQWRRAKRGETWLSLLMLDIDWFKRYNDNYGHVAGDAALASVAAAAAGCLKRDTDLFARYGGEEFVALLWACDGSDAHEVAERIRLAIEKLDVPHAESPIGHVTVSIGVAACRPEGGDAGVLKRAADRALYAAKTSGRDRVVVDRLESTAGGEVAAYRGSNNLRSVGTSFVGRRDDTAAIADLLERQRLVTIAGPAGVGKTRAALAVGQRRVYAYLDGAWFVDFSSVGATGEAVDSAVGVVLGAGGSGTRSARASIVDHVAGKNALLIFDNCEHARDAIATLASEILAAAPRVAILGTSREPLRIENETVYSLQPLDVTTAQALFVERAQAAFPPFDAGPEVHALLSRICERLDNLPLALELAAPLVKTMTLEEIDRGLADRFALLVGAHRGASARQRTLFGALDWSVGLLQPRERWLLQSIAVFPTAATFDAIQSVCADDVVPPAQLWHVLDTLIEKNLVSAIDRTSNERFVLLESTREFVRRELAVRDDAPALEGRFVRYFGSLAKRIGAGIGENRIEESIAVAAAEWPHLRSALQLAFDRSGDLAAGIDIARSLARYWAESGRFADGVYWMDRALAVATDDTPEKRALLYDAALLFNSQADYVRLSDVGERLVALYEENSIGDMAGYARALSALGAARYNLGDAAAAERSFERALEAYRIVGDPRTTALGLMNLASVLLEFEGDAARARPLFMESLRILEDLGPSVQMGIVLANLAALASKGGDPAGAIASSQRSIEVFEKLGNKAFASWPLVDLAGQYLEMGDRRGCFDGLRRARTYLGEQPNFKYVANYCDTAFCLACDIGADELAARFYGFLDAFRVERNVPRLPGDGSAHVLRLAQLQSRLAAPAFERLAAEGARLDFGVLCDALEHANAGITA